MKKRLKQYLLNILAKSRRQEGFTLIEMVVVIAIIVILILPSLPSNSHLRFLSMSTLRI